MNDFLQSLRSSSQRSARTGMTRRAQDHHFHSVNQRFQFYSENNSTEPQSYPAPEYYPKQSASDGEDHNVSSLLLHTIENLSQQIESLTKKQTQLIAAQEKTADVIGRQTRALETIIENVDRFSFSFS